MVHFCPLTPLSCFTGQFLCHEKFSTCHPNVLTDSHVCMRRRSEIRRPISCQLCGHHQLEPTQLYNEPCLFAHHILQAGLCQRQGCNYEKHSNRHTIASNNFSPKPRRRLCSRKFSMYDICSKQPANDAQFRNLSWIKHCLVKTCNMNTWHHFSTYVRDFRSLRRNGNVVNFFAEFKHCKFWNQSLLTCKSNHVKKLPFFFSVRSFLAAEGPLTQGCFTGQPPGTDCLYTGQSPDVLVVGKV